MDWKTCAEILNSQKPKRTVHTYSAQYSKDHAKYNAKRALFIGIVVKMGVKYKEESKDFDFVEFVRICREGE